MTQLDQFHWHEALHMSDAINNMIQTTLIDHVTYEQTPECIKQLLLDAQENLYMYYCYCGDAREGVDPLAFAREGKKRYTLEELLEVDQDVQKQQIEDNWL